MIKVKSEGLFFVSDLHIGHKNMLSICDRGFDNVDDQASFIMEVLQKETKPGDTIIDLGDMFWKKSDKYISDFMEQLKDRTWFKVLGNHDNRELFTKNKKIISYFSGGIYDLLDISLDTDNQMITLSHYPMLSWNHKPWGSIHLFGHCHGNIDNFTMSRPDLMVDVGYDGSLAKQLGTFVIPIKSVMEYFRKKTGGQSFKSWTINKCSEL